MLFLSKFMLVTYFLILILIGYFTSKKEINKYFLIGNRDLSLFAFVSTLIASFVGGGIIVVYTSFIYSFGLGVFFAFFGIVLSYYLLYLSARKIKHIVKQKNVLTINDMFKGESKSKISIISIIVLIYAILITLNQFIAGSSILSSISSFSYVQALLIMMAVILIYVYFGGFQSVVRTDIFQFLLIISFLLFLAFSMKIKTQLSFSSLLLNSTPISLIITFFIWYFNNLASTRCLAESLCCKR